MDLRIKQKEEITMLIIFDFDGVLRNTSWEGLFNAYIALVEHKKKDYRKLFRNLEEFKKWYEPNYMEKLGKDIGYVREELPIVNEIFHSLYDPYIKIFPWTKTLLENLSQRHTLALLSSSSIKSIEKSLDELNSFFSIVVGSEHVRNIKPDPEGIHIILEKLKNSIDDTIIIGDTEVDILAGQAVGIKTGAVRWSDIASWENILDIKPDYVFHNPDELFCL